MNSPRSSKVPIGLLDFAALFAVATLVLGWCTVNGLGLVYPAWSHSDTVWLLSLSRDLFERGGAVADWNLSPHPNFFPEFLIVDAARRASSQLQNFFAWYALAMSACVTAGTWYVLFVYLRASRESAWPLLPTLSASLLGAFAVNSAWLLALNHGLFVEPLRFAFISAFHFGAFVIALPLGALAVDQFGQPISSRFCMRLGVVVVLLTAATLSDKIAALFVLPGLFCAAAYQAIGDRRLSPTVAVTALIAGAAGAASVRFADPFWAQFAHTNAYPVSVDLGSFPTQIRMFVTSLVESSPLPAADDGPPWLRAGIAWALLAGTALLTVAVLARLVRRSATPVKADALLVFLVGSAVSTPILAAAIGRFADARSLRFAIPAVFCPMIAFAAAGLGRFLKRPPARSTLFTSAILISLAAVAFPIRYDRTPWTRFDQTPVAKCLEDLNEDHNLRRGLGDHWRSHLTTESTNGRILVRPIWRDGRIRRWTNSTAWYDASATDEPFTFILVSADFDQGKLRRLFGSPQSVVRCPEIDPEDEVWTVSARNPVDVWIYEGAAAQRLTRTAHRLALE